MDLGFSDYRRLSRRLDKLIKRKLIRCVGTAQLKEDGGRPENVYFIGMIKADWLAHELRITRIVRAAGWPEMLRLYDVPKFDVVIDNKQSFVRPDGFFINRCRLLEMDCETEQMCEIERKVAAYVGSNKAVLFVTLSQGRITKLKQWTKPLEGFAFFALYQDLLENPNGQVWSDHKGEKVALKL